VGFADFAVPQDFLKSPYSVSIDNQAVGIVEADLTNESYVYMSLPGGLHTVDILGTGIFGLSPEIIVNFPQSIYVGESATFDASKSSAIGTIVSYQWSFGDGTNGTGAVVSHSYNETGTYQVGLNVTDSDGLRSFETLTTTVGTPPQYVPLVLKVFLAVVLGLLILMFAVLVRSRRKENVPKQ
jgi:PKD repeat protein